MLRLAASDIDGTLLTGGARTLSPRQLACIRALRRAGVWFCAASGRQYHSLRSLFAPVADDIAYLCENGAIVYVDGAPVYRCPMPRSDALTIAAQILAQEQCEVLISGANVSYLLPKDPAYPDRIRYFSGNNVALVRRMEDIQEDILKVSAYCRDGAARYRPLLGEPWQARYSVAIAGEQWLDFTRADKGAGLAALCRFLGAAPGETAAFGDNFNDVSMLDQAGRPFVMETAHPALLARYPAHCADVADTLEQLLADGEFGTIHKGTAE